MSRAVTPKELYQIWYWAQKLDFEPDAVIGQNLARSQSTTYYMLPFLWNVQKRQICTWKIDQWIPGTRDWSRVMGTRLFKGWWKYSEIDCGDGFTTLNITKHPLSVHFKLLYGMVITSQQSCEKEERKEKEEGGHNRKKSKWWWTWRE